MEKLPVTSYIRLVDIWLIFGQLIPFMEVKSCHKYDCCQAQVQVQVPGQVQKVQGLRTKDLDLG